LNLQILNFSRLTPYPKFPQFKVHAGFYSDYTSVGNQLEILVNSRLSTFKTSKLYVTGHSLGAALAQLAALSFKMDNPRITTNVITFGTPRTGDSAFSSFYSKKIDSSVRITHWRDIVPHLPIRILGFLHTPGEAWFNQAFSSYTFCANEDPKTCSNSVFADSIIDHLHYYNMLNSGCR